MNLSQRMGSVFVEASGLLREVRTLPSPARYLPGVALLLWVSVLSGCILHRHRNADVATSVNPGDQPDKILFQKAVKEVDKGRYDVGRLTLQTLINTYPDSEYLAKAKLAIADSYYKEGGVSGLTQSEAEYKDFITFFPTAPEAPEAQYRAGMAHFRLMAKYDRDRSEAKQAEAEFKEFLVKYPDNPYMPRVKARLREVQELLAEGDYQIAKLYYQRGAVPAARSRFEEIANQYPNFSQAEKALWYLGQSLERLHKPDEAAPYYARIITDYPLSPEVAEAKSRLTALHQPIPHPTKAMLARAKADAVDRRKHQRSRFDVISRVESAMSSSPDTSRTRHGPVQIGQGAPGQVEEAKTPAAAPGGASIAVQPLDDTPSGSAKRDPSKPPPNSQNKDPKDAPPGTSSPPQP